MNRIVPPVWPYRGTRLSDAWGTGNYGASRDGGARVHLGLDFISQPGDLVMSVFAGKVISTGWAYPDTGELGSLWLEGEGEWKHWRAQYLYVKALIESPGASVVGRRFDAGELLAHAQDVSAYYSKKDPKRHMINHVHLMLLGPTDPSRLLPEGLHA